MTVYNIIWYFFIYSFLGWCLEVCFCSIQTGSFVNRGFLNGPVCPIYGFGMLIAGSALIPVRDNLIALFFGGMVLASALELAGGWVLKKLFHTTWWDYSDEPFNIGGYICLKFSLAWGACFTFAIRVVHPAVAAFVRHFPRVPGVVLCAVFCVLIVIDIAATVASILRLEQALGRIAAVAARMREGSDAIAESLGDTAIAVDGRLDSYGPEFSARMDLMRAEMADNRHRAELRLLRAFPHMKNLRHSEALDVLRGWLQSKTDK